MRARFRRWRSALQQRRVRRWLLLMAFIWALAALLALEVRTSWFQASYYSRKARQLEFEMTAGGGEAIRFPDSGPYDERLGYTRLDEFSQRLQSSGYRLGAQAQWGEALLRVADQGLFVPYDEKMQAGLALLDCRDEPQYHARFPLHVYPTLEAVPRLLIDALLFVENRELLSARPHTRNPAIEWDRFTKALFDQLWSVFDADHPTPGASTLATQIEKYRHSPGGRTATAGEKLRQMRSASLRAYRFGKDTRLARRHILLQYLNSMPLSARPGFGEVHGLGDGMWAWYGRDFAEMNRLLWRAEQPDASPEDVQSAAMVLKEAISLFIAQRRPSYYLLQAPQELERHSNSYLRLLTNSGRLSPRLRDAALPLRLQLRPQLPSAPNFSFVNLKAQNALRAQISSMLQMPRLYDVDRLDLTATSTLNGRVQRRLGDVLQQLRNPEDARAKGLYGFRLLGPGDDPRQLIISFSLFEKGETANRLRVQIDNVDQPFDLNEGARLDLGSTAKLRTLVHYLQIIAELHERYAAQDPAALRALSIHPRDALSRWAVSYLAEQSDRELRPMLEAAMDRRYSASPYERFFTGGGLHSFENFEREDNGRVLTLREAFTRSVNLVFIRVMRDIEHYYLYRPGGIAEDLEGEGAEARRREYLERFADREGRTFISNFYRKYQGKSPAEVEALLLKGLKQNPRRIAVAIRHLEPTADFPAFEAAMRRHVSGAALPPKRMRQLYEQSDPAVLPLVDRGYVARVHPLELWLAGYLRQNPDASLGAVLAESRDERIESYGWLFRSDRKHAQDQRIRIVLEADAFREITRQWRRLGYPFEALTPSYASSIGASGDRPAALAELMGIIINGGVRKPTIRLESLHFAANTPYETRFERVPGAAERVLAPEVAQVARAAILSVVEEGTARRIREAFKRPDGSRIAVGGKTGTGDHRYEVYGPGARLISARVINRSATFVFMLGDRFYGTLTIYVPEPYAERFRFTSALTVQLLASLAEGLMPLFDPEDVSLSCPPAIKNDQRNASNASQRA